MTQHGATYSIIVGFFDRYSSPIFLFLVRVC